MAVMAAMGCSCAARGLVPLSPSPSTSSFNSIAAAGEGPILLRGNLKLRHAQLRSSSRSDAAVINVGQRRRRFGEVGVRAGTCGHSKSHESIEAEKVTANEDLSGFYEKALLSAAAGLTPLLLNVQTASAAGGEFGLLEGRSFALIHPIVMGGLFVYTLYAGYLGWQWRRVRTIQTEINELKKQVTQVPVAAGDKSAPPTPPSPLESQISSLTEERKELVKGGFRDKHFNAGSILLAFGVLESVGGSLNTWIRTGKLFPGPHLFAGAGITVCWALAAALVPAMQKGNETARNLHIGLNVINVALFVWQIPTGWEIVLKVFEFTKWP